MSETARRTGYGHHSDVVRRLIARPIRLQGAPAPETAREPTIAVEAPLSQPLAAAEPAPTTIPAIDSERLKLEMTLMKAVLQAERRENASLRACVGLDEADESLGVEARAVRDRWASLVDRLLHAAD